MLVLQTTPISYLHSRLSVDAFGSYYNIAFNNCQQVTTDVAKELCGFVELQQMGDYIQANK